MAITDYKITEQQIAEKGVVAAPDMLTGTAQENKGVFDRLVRETVAPAFNGVVDALADENEQRNADEATRKTQENARVAAEELRAAAENGRVAAETARETAERQRADETAGIVAQATRQAEAAENAKTAAEDAREETIRHKDSAYRYALDAAISKNTAEASAAEAGQQAGSASGFAARAEEALSKMGVHIGSDAPTNGAKLWMCPVNNPLVMNPDRASSDMTQEVGVNDDGKLVTTVEDGSISESKLAQDVKDKLSKLSEEIANLGGGTGTGAPAQNGVGIQSVEQTITSTEDGGTNVVTVTKTDGTSSTFQVRNGSKGSPGAPGKSAYQYAQEGGYTGTEAEFAAKLAEEIPDKLPNPNALTFTGAVTGSYDGSEPLTVNIPSSEGGSGGSGGLPNWRLIKTLEFTTDIVSFEFSTDDAGNAFSLSEIMISGVAFDIGGGYFYAKPYKTSVQNAIWTTANKNMVWWLALIDSALKTVMALSDTKCTWPSDKLPNCGEKITNIIVGTSATPTSGGTLYVYGR